MQTLGVILAGGAGTRLGGRNKAFEKIGGVSCLDRVIARFAPQVDAFVVNANGADPRWATRGAVVPDRPDQMGLGPLAGILSGLRHATERGFERIATAAVDTPFLPRDLVARLGKAADDATATVAIAAGHHIYPVAGLWPTSALSEIERAFHAGEHSPAALAKQFGTGIATWPTAPFDPFANLNAEEDRAALDAIAARLDQDEPLVR